jgi:hypothetical protein
MPSGSKSFGFRQIQCRQPYVYQEQGPLCAILIPDARFLLGSPPKNRHNRVKLPVAVSTGPQDGLPPTDVMSIRASVSSSTAMGSEYSALPVNAAPAQRTKGRSDSRSIPGSTSQPAPELPRPQAALLGRGTSRSVGISALLHAVLLALLSLIVIHQSGPAVPILAEMRFEEQDGTGEKLEFLPELEAPVPETQSPASQSAEVALMEGGVTISSDLKMDFSRFADSSGSTASNVVAEAAAGIQDRVRKAGGKTGEIQFSLAWHSFNDLDLHVIAPSGEHVNYRH